MKLLTTNNFKTIFFISVVYGAVVGWGLYGFNIDFHQEYSKGNLFYRSIFDGLGSYLASLKIINISIGVYLLSFFLAFSFGIFLFIFVNLHVVQNNYQKYYKYINIYIILIYLLALHTHSIIMSTSGAMRQGWVMVMIFFALSFLIQKKIIFSFIFIFFSIFLHKSGIIFFIFYTLTYILLFLLNYSKEKVLISVLFLLINSICFYFVFFNFNEITNDGKNQRIIGNDMRIPWYIFNFIYLYIYLKTQRLLLVSPINFTSTFLFVSLGGMLPLGILGLSDYFERMNMVLSLILIFASSFYTKGYFFYMISGLLIILYFFLTVYLGMYSEGLY